jgi:hypothetical protein
VAHGAKFPGAFAEVRNQEEQRASVYGLILLTAKLPVSDKGASLTNEHRPA